MHREPPLPPATAQMRDPRSSSEANLRLRSSAILSRSEHSTLREFAKLLAEALEISERVFVDEPSKAATKTRRALHRPDAGLRVHLRRKFLSTVRRAPPGWLVSDAFT